MKLPVATLSSFSSPAPRVSAPLAREAAGWAPCFLLSDCTPEEASSGQPGFPDQALLRSAPH